MFTHLHNELDRLVKQYGGGACQLQMAAPGGALSVDVDMINALACTFTLFQLRADRLSSATIDELTSVANDLSNRLSYLLESISPVEIDRDMCVVQMRSSPPEQGDQGTFYYELVVRKGAIELCRYQKTPGDVRHTVPATVTREVLQRLANDFLAAVPA